MLDTTRALAAALPLAATLLLPGAARAEVVWISCHYGTTQCPEQSNGELDDLVATWESQGATVIVDNDIGMQVAEVETSILVILRPEEWFDVPVRTQIIPTHLGAGGRLVLLADSESAESDSNALIRDLLATISGHDLALGSESLPAGCDSVTADIYGDPLTAGLGRWHYNNTNTVSGGDALVRFPRPDGGDATLIAVGRRPNGGELLLAGDAAGFLMECDGQGFDFASDHAALWRNLYDDTSLALDNDGDGYDSALDCDDTDPFVYPGAYELCNGIDDDCDGTVDEGCGDDDDDDDDDDTAGGDDDDTAGGDDDDVASGDDDDTTDGGGDSWGGSCGGGGAALLFPLLLPLSRRRIG